MQNKLDANNRVLSPLLSTRPRRSYNCDLIGRTKHRWVRDFFLLLASFMNNKLSVLYRLSFFFS